MNKVILIGRLTKDVDVRQTPNGHNVARFSVAVNRRFKNANGQFDVDFINCVAWRQTGEFIARYFQKGNMIAVVGNIQSRSWDGQDGKKQYATEVVVDEVYFTGGKSESNTKPKSENGNFSDARIDELNNQFGADFTSVEYDEELDDLPF